MNYTLNEKQQKMVEEYLELVSIVLKKHITSNEQIRGLEYDDLYQCGCLALCKAAATYDGRVKFETYASRVIHNALIDECRAAKSSFARHLSYDAFLNPEEEDCFSEILTDDGDIAEDMLCEELMQIVQTAKKQQKGAVLKGIEAIELKIKGYSGAEIAEMYGVKNNNVTSWISKAVAVMRNEYPEYCRQ